MWQRLECPWLAIPETYLSVEIERKGLLSLIPGTWRCSFSSFTQRLLHLQHKVQLNCRTTKEMTLCHFFLYSVEAGFGAGREQGMPRKIPWGISLDYCSVPAVPAGSQAAMHSSKQLLHQLSYNLWPFKLFFHSIVKPFLLAIICTKFIFERCSFLFSVRHLPPCWIREHHQNKYFL